MKINNNNNNNIIELQLAYKVIEFISILNNVQSSFNNKLYLNNQTKYETLKDNLVNLTNKVIKQNNIGNKNIINNNFIYNNNNNNNNININNNYNTETKNNKNINNINDNGNDDRNRKQLEFYKQKINELKMKNKY